MGQIGTLFPGNEERAIPGVTPEFAEMLRVKSLEEKIDQLRVALVCGFNQLLDLKDLNTGVHSTRLAEWGVRLAENMGVDEGYQHDVEMAALVHDIGKIGVPDSILQKPGRLTREEYEIIKKHSEWGWGILRMLPDFERISLFVLHHHEHVNGAGYPAGLRGDEIPLGARIVCLLDSFDAMVSDRCYRKGLPLEEAIRRLTDASGRQFDPQLVERFLPLATRELSQVAEITNPFLFHPSSSRPF